MKKVVDHPVPVVLEKITPYTVEKPLKYKETVTKPVTKKDGAGVASEKHTTINNSKADDHIHDDLDKEFGDKLNVNADSN